MEDRYYSLNRDNRLGSKYGAEIQPTRASVKHDNLTKVISLGCRA